MRACVMTLLCLFLLGAVAAVTAQEQAKGTTTGPAEEGRLTGEEIGESVLSSMDLTADPCVDFYQYACGSWIERTELPPDRPRWNRAFSVVIERNREVIRSLLNEVSASPGDDPVRQAIGYFYGSCMNEEAIEKAGAAPLQPILAEIATVKDAASLLAVTGKLHRRGIAPLFGVQVIPDFKRPDYNTALMAQGGLGLPDRDYYVSDDEKKQELLADYQILIADMLQLVGEEEQTATRNAASIVAFETELAKVSRDRTAMRQYDKLYNKINLAGLKKLTPKLPWEAYLKAAGHPEVSDINVATPEFFEALEGLVVETKPEVLRAYLRWHAISAMAPQLSSDFVETSFAFFGRKLSGQQALEPRWKRCVDATQGALGEAIGKLYVDKMFAGSSKEIALEMIVDLETAFGNNLSQLTWMDEVTRKRAAEKLATTKNKIGYPDQWRDYSAMQLTPTSYANNTMAAAAFQFDFEANKIGNPVDAGEWHMPPQMVNAYANPLANEIVFPAGILQPPFFHRDFPAAMNYGAIGGAIGHELTHGYDDQGRKFNAKGEMKEWWEPQVAEAFAEQAQCIDDLYSSYEIEPGVTVNGTLTLGENIADTGGLKQAYRAYKLWEKRHGTPEPVVEGLTNEQLLFVSWGQIWCSVMSPEYLRMQVTTDPHTPPTFRVIGPISNNPDFAKAFSCEPGTPMNPEEKCVVW